MLRDYSKDKSKSNANLGNRWVGHTVSTPTDMRKDRGWPIYITLRKFDIETSLKNMPRRGFEIL